jgi:hypothetical protein
LPWGELPEAVRERERDMVQGLPAFLAQAGFQVQRIPKSESPDER